MALPTLCRALQIHFYASRRCKWSPAVLAERINGRAEVKPRTGLHTHLATHPVWPGHSHFIDVYHQCVALHAPLTRADGELLLVAVAISRTALGHGPTTRLFAVERHIECAMVVGVTDTALATLPRVVG